MGWLLDEKQAGVEESTDGFVLPPGFPMLAEGGDAYVLLVAVGAESLIPLLAVLLSERVRVESDLGGGEGRPPSAPEASTAARTARSRAVGAAAPDRSAAGTRRTTRGV